MEINDKHIEIIIRQMLRKVKITEPGDTELPLGRSGRPLDVRSGKRARHREQGGKPAEADPVLLGITKASLETELHLRGFFQDTTRVLTEAATLGKVDLRGFKENVIMGHLIPAGTGFKTNREIEIVHIGDALQSEPEPHKAAS